MSCSFQNLIALVFFLLFHFILKKSENWIFGKFCTCNLAANVTNDAIKVGAPSYKLLLNPTRQTLYLPHSFNYCKSKQKLCYFLLEFVHSICDGFKVRFSFFKVLALMGTHDKVYWHIPLRANKNSKFSYTIDYKMKTFECGIFSILSF